MFTDKIKNQELIRSFPNSFLYSLLILHYFHPTFSAVFYKILESLLLPWVLCQTSALKQEHSFLILEEDELDIFFHIFQRISFLDKHLCQYLHL